MEKEGKSKGRIFNEILFLVFLKNQLSMNLSEQAKSIINSNIDKQTKLKELVSLVSEIPYKRIGSLNPSDMVFYGKGSCTPKHVFLAKYLKEIQVPVKFLVIPFYYKKASIQFPQDQQELIQNMPISYHIALSVEINNRWTILDVTWDSELKSFPINENWDGVSDMNLAVTPEKIIERASDPRHFERKMSLKYSDSDKQIRAQFYHFFDTFLEKSRK